MAKQYMETVANIPKIQNLGLPADQEMAINCEWGAFDSFEHQFLRALLAPLSAPAGACAVVAPELASARETDDPDCSLARLPSQPARSTTRSSTRRLTSRASRRLRR